MAANEVAATEHRLAAGAARAARFGESWQRVSGGTTIRQLAGENPIVETTASGKTIYHNIETGVRVVYDNAGKYFRVIDTSANGTARYLDQFGKPIPPNVPMIQPDKITETGVPRDIRNALTHFLDSDTK